MTTWKLINHKKQKTASSPMHTRAIPRSSVGRIATPASAVLIGKALIKEPNMCMNVADP